MRGAHVRHRRGVVAALVLAALAAGAAAVTTGVLRLRTDERTPAAAAPADLGRRPWQVSLGIDATFGFVVTAGVTDGARQTLTVQDLTQGGKPDGRYGGEVTAFPPGTLDETQFSSGERVDDSWYLAAFAFSAHAIGETQPWRGPAVGRRDRTGAWVVAYADTGRPDGAIGRADLLRLATAATIGPPRDLRMPLRLGPAQPAGLQLTYVRSPDQRIDHRPAELGLSSPARPPSGAAVYSVPPRLDVTVFAGPRDAAWARTRKTLSGATRAAGLPAWYEPGVRLTVEAERCVVTLRSTLPRAQLDALVAGLTIGDCTDPDSWIPPLS